MAEKFMKTPEYLANKLYYVAKKLIGYKKRNDFVNSLKEMNTDLPRSRVTKRILEMFDNKDLTINENAEVIAGPNFKIIDDVTQGSE